MSKKKPTLGVLLGDSSGIGPEIVAKLISRPEIYEQANVLIVGDHCVFRMGQKIAGLFQPVTLTDHIESAGSAIGQPFFYDYPAISDEEVTLGKVNLKSGKAVVNTLSFMLDLAIDKKIDGFIFAPFNKEAMILGGLPYHSELDFFKAKFNRPNIPGEVNVLDDLWTTRVTSHIGISQVSALITRENVHNTIRFMDGVLRTFGVKNPRLAVSALNPHAGEGGMFGSEEKEAISPAIEMAKAEGISAEGPFPADTIYLRIKKGNYHAVVSMYHDQGQIATKLMGFDRGITVHGGLPIAIATPAHGSAFDIAGQGKANPEGLIRAFLTASRLAANLKLQNKTQSITGEIKAG
ncbi:MAG: isocitrate/isopropylmalate family dehydrogenase [Deltaproteobacteria bacterium]|nr:isocitrate/isopropylmalate family dehydrogenase [Deltaproteobacteria bacterium]